MRDPIRVTKATLTPATAELKATGLLGFISLVIDDALGLDGVTLRRATGGELLLSFPERRDSHGRPHPIARPMDRRARAVIESQVFEKLGLDPHGDRRAT